MGFFHRLLLAYSRSLLTVFARSWPRPRIDRSACDRGGVLRCCVEGVQGQEAGGMSRSGGDRMGMASCDEVQVLIDDDRPLRSDIPPATLQSTALHSYF
jgi:hypothetical protein